MPLLGHVTPGVGDIVNRIGQQGVQVAWKTSNQYTQGSAYAHGKKHVEWSFFTADARVVGKKGEEGNFDSSMVENASRGEEEHQPDSKIPLAGGFGHDHGFTDKAAE